MKMEKMNTLKTVVLLFVGSVGSIIADALGGWGTDIRTLLIFMGVDFVMGLLLAAVFNKSSKSESGALNSISAWKGLVRKGVSLLIVMVAHRLDILLGFDYIRTAVIIAFCTDELISIVENMGVMGIPLPAIIKNAIEILKKKADIESENK